MLDVATPRSRAISAEESPNPSGSQAITAEGGLPAGDESHAYLQLLFLYDLNPSVLARPSSSCCLPLVFPAPSDSAHA